MSEDDKLENVLVKMRQARQKAAWAKPYREMSSTEKWTLFVHTAEVICQQTCGNHHIQVKHLHQSL